MFLSDISTCLFLIALIVLLWCGPVLFDILSAVVLELLQCKKHNIILFWVSNSWVAYYHVSQMLKGNTWIRRHHLWLSNSRYTSISWHYKVIRAFINPNWLSHKFFFWISHWFLDHSVYEVAGNAETSPTHFQDNCFVWLKPCGMFLQWWRDKSPLEILVNWSHYLCLVWQICFIVGKMCSMPFQAKNLD